MSEASVKLCTSLFVAMQQLILLSTCKVLFNRCSPHAMLTNRIVVSKDLVQVLSPNSWCSSELKPNECGGIYAVAYIVVPRPPNLPPFGIPTHAQ